VEWSGPRLCQGCPDDSPETHPLHLSEMYMDEMNKMHKHYYGMYWEQRILSNKKQTPPTPTEEPEAQRPATTSQAQEAATESAEVPARRLGLDDLLNPSGDAQPTASASAPAPVSGPSRPPTERQGIDTMLNPEPSSSQTRPTK